MKIFSKALITVSLVFSILGCDALYNATSVKANADEKATQAAADAAVAELDTSLPFKVISFTKEDGSSLTTAVETTMTVSGTNITSDLVNISGTGIEKTVAFRAVTLDFAVKNGGTSNYTDGQIINLGASDFSLVVTSKDTKVTKTYTIHLTLTNVPTVVGAIGTAVGGWGADAFKLNLSGATLTAVATLQGVDAAVAGSGELKFRQDNAWANSWGQGGALKTGPVAPTKTNGNIHYYDMGGGNIVIPTTGLYFIQLNFVTKQIIIEPVTTIGVIGSAVPGAWGVQNNFTWNAATDVGTWTGTVTNGASDKFKIRVNGNWDIAFGGAAGVADFNGGDIVPGTAGTGITFNGRTFAYTITP